MEIKKIYVFSPGEKDNGGGESLHQLVNTLNNIGYDAYIYYFDSRRESILERMNSYNVKLAKNIEDKECNLLICPEMFTYPLKQYKKINKVIWFLSLDFYLRSCPIYRTKFVCKKWRIPILFFPIVWIMVLMKTDANLKTYSLKKGNIKFFLYNVEYAREYIESNCKTEHVVKYLCGPINDIYFSDKMTYKKEWMVVYNPKKADKFTDKVIKAYEKRDKKVLFVPIINLEQAEVKNLLGRAAVYIDFGFFPGPERIPREAAIMGCNIITSKLGSARNSKDVPISEKYKFELLDENITHIVNLIYDMVYNYEKYVSDFEEYRRKVIAQKENFDLYVKDFLECVESNET